MEPNHKLIAMMRDNIHSINSPMIKRFASAAGMTSERHQHYKFNIIFDAFKTWAYQMLKTFVANYIEHKSSKYYLDPKDINFGFDIEHANDDHYNMIQILPFKRLMLEIHQQVMNDKHLNLHVDISFSSNGFYMMVCYFVGKSIEFFTVLKQRMDAVGRKLVSESDIQYVLEQMPV